MNLAMTKSEAKPIAAINELFSKSPDGLREIVRGWSTHSRRACSQLLPR